MNMLYISHHSKYRMIHYVTDSLRCNRLQIFLLLLLLSYNRYFRSVTCYFFLSVTCQFFSQWPGNKESSRFIGAPYEWWLDTGTDIEDGVYVGTARTQNLNQQAIRFSIKHNYNSPGRSSSRVSCGFHMKKKIVISLACVT